MKTRQNMVWRVVGGVVLPFVIGSSLTLTGCPNDTKPDTKPNPGPVVPPVQQGPQRTFELTLLGKKVSVVDKRTGANDQTLEQLGVMDKLESVVDFINSNIPSEIREVYDRVLERGLVIELDTPAVLTEFSRTRGDRTVIFDLNDMINPAKPANIFTPQLDLAIVNYLDKGIDKVS
jgi:hypothetical protein